jgi:acyl transferase domain-containing protein/thioesterase domain-containing protein/SAM-dependent methyltransferase
MSTDGIAIVGAGARLPGAANVAEFWRNLRAGADTISRFGPDTLRAAGVAEDMIGRPGYVPARGVLAGGEDFDWRFFGYSAAEAATIDPQQRLFLEVCWAACNDAGLDPARFPGWVGVFAGCDVTADRSEPATIAGLIGAEKDFLATRVAYKLKLRGPAITVQTACSTSLVAVHQACQSLLNHECDAALAGGVALWLPQTTGYLYQADHILSVDGHCRTFDADSSGTVSSNGAGVVVLRRIDDAVADGDRIMAVLRGSALNNDGGEKIGYTAPSLTGQRDVIRLALAQADVDPADLGYVEAHGTATQLGDPVEVAALTSAFRHATDRVGYCWLGSVKSNIGHTGAASGVAGLLKTALVLEHRELVPSLHFRTPNPKLDLDSSPFRVVTDHRELTGPALAAVSSFGIGGTNAHAVLEAPPRSTHRGRGPRVFCLSAPSAATLRRASTELADRLTERPDPVAVAWTLTSGRPALAHRRSVVAEELDTAIESLREPVAGVPVGEPRVAFVFPGQGALYPGAVDACHELLPVFRDVFDQAAELVRARWDVDLPALLAPDAPAEPLRDSFVQQVGLFSVGYALGRQLLEWGVRPVAMLGHSAGEYVAAALAGAWDLADGLAVVAARALAMRAGPPGGMIAVYAPLADLPPDHGLDVATEGPGQVVLAGPVAAIERLRAGPAGVTATVLDADRPFHTERMRPATDDLRAALTRLPPGQPTLPVVSNLTGGLLAEDRLRDPGYWSDHLCGRVLLTDGMATLLAQDCDVVVELGPGQTMTGGLRRHERWHDTCTAVPLLGRAAEPRGEALLDALGGLWAAGVPVDWDSLFDERPVRCALPPIPLDSAPCTSTAAKPTELTWPDTDEVTVSGRPDLLAALREFAAGLVGRFVLDTGLATLTAPGRLPRLAGFLLSVLRDEGWLTDGSLVPDLAARVSAALARAAELAEVAGLRDLLRHCVGHYPDVFAGRTEPVAVLYPGGADDLLTRCLTGNDVPIADSERCLAAVRQSVPAWYAGSGESLRVLEIGAGRGGLTWPLLDAWTDRGHYDVTDVSPLLVAHLGRRAAERGDHDVRARVFDITADPAGQGLVPGEYDLILGYNVVHVAPSVPAALANLRRLLRPGGTLCLVELTRAERWTHLVWGLAPGWWHAEDDLRGPFPHLDVPAWTAALTSAGFDVTAADGPADHAVLVATAQRTAPAPARATPVASDSSTDTVARLWREALGGTTVSDADDFYQLGGESLGVVQLLARVHETTGVRVPLADFAMAPTFASLVRRVRDEGGDDVDSPNLLRLARHGDGVPLIFTAPGAGSTLCYRHVVPALGGREPVYGLESPGLHDDTEPLTRIEDIAEANLALLREVQPTGPYRLAGWSVGAMVAHEMAARLLAGGERVDRLLCVDGFVPWTWGLPIGARPGYLARGLWYQAETALPTNRAGNLGAALGLAGVDQGAAFVRVYQANVRAMLRYAPRPVDCAAVIFKTGLTERIQRRVERAVSGNYRRGVRLIGVPGDHHSVLGPRFAGVLGDRIRHALDNREG